MEAAVVELAEYLNLPRHLMVESRGVGAQVAHGKKVVVGCGRCREDTFVELNEVEELVVLNRVKLSLSGVLEPPLVGRSRYSVLGP
jgi:hypothetical protein